MRIPEPGRDKDLKITFTRPQPDFYVVGGTMKASAPSYVVRESDTQLLEGIRRNEFCYVLTSRQMGKSSLMVRTAAQLKEAGTRSVIIDLTSLGTTNLTPESWYLGQIQRMCKQLALGQDYVQWWESQSHLGIVQRFTNFLTDVLVEKLPETIVIFVDEIDTTLSLPFSDDYFAAIRSLYNDRALNSKLDRLNFVLLGVASPADLIKDPKRTPFNIGRRIELTDFTFQEAQPLIAGLAPEPQLSLELLRNILGWTGGQPYLTQKACSIIAAWAERSWAPVEVSYIADKLVDQFFLSETGRNTDENLRFVQDRILESAESRKLLEFYLRIRQGEPLSYDDLDTVTAALMLSGLIKAAENRRLQVRNTIYERVFDESWIRASLGLREPFDRARHLKKAQWHIVQGRVPDAIVEYQKVLKENPKDWELTMQLGELYLLLHEKNAAIRSFEKTANAYYSDGLYQKAIAIYKKIQKIDLDLTDFHVRLAEIYLKQGLKADAKLELEAAKNQYEKKGQIKQIIEVLKLLIEAEPENLKHRNELVRTYQNQDMLNEAVQQYLEISDFCHRKGLLNESLSALEHALKIDAQNQTVLQQIERLTRKG